MTTSMEFVASAEITAADGIRSSVAGAAAAFTVAHYRLINTTSQTPSREISRAKWYLLLATGLPSFLPISIRSLSFILTTIN